MGEDARREGQPAGMGRKCLGHPRQARPIFWSRRSKMVAQALFMVLSTHGGRAGTIGAAGLTVLGTVGTVGVLAETIAYKVLSTRAFDAPKTAITHATADANKLWRVSSRSTPKPRPVPHHHGRLESVKKNQGR